MLNKILDASIVFFRLTEAVFAVTPDTSTRMPRDQPS